MVLRKLRSEKLSQLDRHKGDVFIYSNVQSDVLMRMLQSDKVTLYIDATVTIIRKPTFFYYAPVINATERIYPILEMVSSYHDSATIGSWLLPVKVYVIVTKNKWLIFNHVVCNFSFAILNVIVIFWINMDIVTYLMQTYEVAIDKVETKH